MEKTQAQLILTKLKRHMTQREVYEALDMALESLAWDIAEEKLRKTQEETQCDQKKEQN